MNENYNDNIDEAAILIITPLHLGVTNDFKDIVAYAEEYRDIAQKILIKFGMKSELLLEEHKILVLDNLSASDGSSLIVPHMLTNYNLIERKTTSSCPFLTVVDLLEKHE